MLNLLCEFLAERPIALQRIDDGTERHLLIHVIGHGLKQSLIHSTYELPERDEIEEEPGGFAFGIPAHCCIKSLWQAKIAWYQRRK